MMGGVVKHMLLRLEVAGTNGDNLEANLLESRAVEHKTTVEDKGWAGAVVVNLLPVELLELVPLSADDDSLGVLACLLGSLAEGDVLLDGSGVLGTLLGEVHPDLVVLDLGVVDVDTCLLGEEVVGNGDGWGLAGVSSVLLEGPTEDGNLLTGDGVEEGVNDLAGEAVLLVLVHLNNGEPVLGNLGKVEGLGKVDKVENVLLEARTTESNRSLEELGADTRVLADSEGDLVNVGAGSLTDGREGVDRGDTLSKHGVGGELGELRGPEADGENAVTGNPVGVDLGEGGAGILARLGLEGADEDTVGGEEVADGGTLSKELGVGENVEAASGLGVGLKDGAHSTACQHTVHKIHSLGGAARDGRLLYDNLARGGDLGDAAGSELEEVEVGSEALSDTRLLGGGVDRDEDKAKC